MAVLKELYLKKSKTIFSGKDPLEDNQYIHLAYEIDSGMAIWSI